MKYAAAFTIKQLKASSQFCDGNVGDTYLASVFVLVSVQRETCSGIQSLFSSLRLSGVRRRKFPSSHLKFHRPRKYLRFRTEDTCEVSARQILRSKILQYVFFFFA